MKKLFSIFLTIGILGITTNAYAVVAKTPLTVAANINQTLAVSHGVLLGAMDKKANTTLENNKIMRRDEFAKALVISAGLMDTANSLKYQSVFSDVPSSNKMVGYVNAAINQGFLTGMSDGKFHPEQNITFAQACTAALRALGYSDNDMTGVWPNNYINKARELKLIDGLNFKNNDGLTRGGAAVLIDRLLNTNIKKSNPQDVDKTLVSNAGYFTDSIILGNSKTSSKLADNQIMTDQGIYYLNDTSVQLVVGDKYRLNISDNTIDKIYYDLKTVKSVEITDVNDNVITYLSNNKSVNMTLSDKVVYYYNGVKQSYDSIISTALQTASSIVFANNDNNVGYEYAVVLQDTTGTNGEYIILGNSTTMDSINDNEILTDKGILYLNDSSLKLEIGNKYRLLVENDKVIKAQNNSNPLKTIIVSSTHDNDIVYSDNGKNTDMVLPDNVVYYNAGVKQTYDNLNNIIQGDSTIIFANNMDNVGYEYAVIIDPVYSKAEIALNVKAGDKNIGKINLSDGELIVKNGGYININDIQDGDVVYQVSDIANSYKYIFDMDSKVEGKLTGILPNRLYPKTIQIDNKNYAISKDMDMTKLTNKDSIYNIGDTVQILSGYDTSIVDISKTSVVGTNIDCIILGNSKTSSNLADNQILTDNGIFYLTDNNLNLALGSKYTLYIGNDRILSASKAINVIKNVVVNNVKSTGITYIEGGKELQMTLPDKVSYYYQGVKQSYSNLINVLKVDSTLIFAYNTDGVGYEYAAIIDPVYSKPVIANNVKAGDKNIGSIDLTNWGSVVKNGEYINPYSIVNGDVVYQISDIQNTNSYILALDTKVTGVITGITPNRINPTTIQIDNKDYDLSNDFDISKLTDKSSPFKINDTVQISMGYDGKVVNLDYLEGQENANVAYVLNTSIDTINGNPIYYAKILKSDGTTGTYKSYLDATSLKGCLATFTNIDDTTILLNVINNQSYPEMTINKDDMRIGKSYATDNIRIFDVISNIAGADANVKVLNWNDLYSGTLLAGQVSYLSPVGDFGDINVMVLNDVFNEGYSDGLVKSATAITTGSGNRKTTTYNYTIGVGGKDYQWSTANVYGISTMNVVSVSISGGQISSYAGIVSFDGEGTKIQAIDAKKIKLNDNIYKFRNDVVVYYLNTSGTFSVKAIGDIDITQTYSKVDIYLDKSLNYDGKVKMIVITQ